MRKMAMVVGLVLTVSMAQAEEAAEQVEDAQPKKEKVKKEKKAKAPKVKKEKAPAGEAPAEKKPKAKKVKPVVEKMTIKGVITKLERKKGEKVTVSYQLTDGEGNKMRLPRPKKPKKPKEGEEPAKPIKLADYADAAVTVTAKVIKIKKGDKVTIVVKELLGIEKAGGVADVEVFQK